MKTRSLLRAALAACTCMGLASAASAQTYAISTNPAGVSFIAGVNDSGNHCDDCTTPISIPFPFTFFGTPYSSVNAGSNGFLDFTQAHGLGFYSNQCLPALNGTTDGTNSFGPTIFAHWDDLIDTAPNGIFTTTVGSSPNRTFVIEWRTGFFTGSGTLNFEVLLYEGQSNFDVVYNSIPNNGASATAGVENTPVSPISATPSVQFSCNTASLIPGLVLRYTFVPPTSGACCDGVGGCTLTAPNGCTPAANFQGAGTTCAPFNACGGACCDAGGNCTVSTASGCSGIFINGQACSVNPCSYCVAGSNTCGTADNDERISEFVFNTIDNVTGAGDGPAGCYADFTSTSTVVSPGVTYAITLYNAGVYAGDQAGVWFDWDHNFSFDAGEQVTLTSADGNATFTGTVTVPGTALVGNTRMRARVMYTGTLGPCGSTTYGDVQDYTVTVTAGAPGACCAADGTCTVVLPTGCPAPSLFQATSTACGPNNACPATVSACCNNSTGACVFVNGTNCPAGSTNQGAGSTCVASSCPVVSTCCDNTTAACTLIYGGSCPSGTGSGVGTTCSATACPSGACCNSATLICSVLSATGCGGGYQGDNTTCESAPCSFGACCAGCAGCNISTAGDCASIGGTYNGDGSTCDTLGCTIINGGFESGTFAPGWTQYGADTALVGVFTGTGPGAGAQTPHSGNYAYDAGPTENPPVNGIRQNIPAHVGDQVTISFWYAAAGGGPNEFILTFDGQALTDMVNDLAHPTWSQLTFMATSTSDNPLLDMNFYNGPAWTFIDDVNICISPASAGGVCCRGATCNATVAQASCTGSGTAGAFFASSGSTCNSGAVSNTPCCYADYNKANGITVQDIFDFLSDWFAGNNFAKVGGDGSSGPLAVQNIFDFLSDWFAGGCS